MLHLETAEIKSKVAFISQKAGIICKTVALQSKKVETVSNFISGTYIHYKTLFIGGLGNSYRLKPSSEHIKLLKIYYTMPTKLGIEVDLKSFQ